MLLFTEFLMEFFFGHSVYLPKFWHPSRADLGPRSTSALRISEASASRRAISPLLRQIMSSAVPRYVQQPLSKCTPSQPRCAKICVLHPASSVPPLATPGSTPSSTWSTAIGIPLFMEGACSSSRAFSRVNLHSEIYGPFPAYNFFFS
jgi:hypothetical protein